MLVGNCVSRTQEAHPLHDRLCPAHHRSLVQTFCWPPSTLPGLSRKGWVRVCEIQRLIQPVSASGKHPKIAGLYTDHGGDQAVHARWQACPGANGAAIGHQGYAIAAPRQQAVPRPACCVQEQQSAFVERHAWHGSNSGCAEDSAGARGAADGDIRRRRQLGRGQHVCDCRAGLLRLRHYQLAAGAG